MSAVLSTDCVTDQGESMVQEKVQLLLVRMPVRRGVPAIALVQPVNGKMGQWGLPQGDINRLGLSASTYALALRECGVPSLTFGRALFDYDSISVSGLKKHIHAVVCRTLYTGPLTPTCETIAQAQWVSGGLEAILGVMALASDSKRRKMIEAWEMLHTGDWTPQVLT